MFRNTRSKENLAQRTPERRCCHFLDDVVDARAVQNTRHPLVVPRTPSTATEPNCCTADCERYRSYPHSAPHHLLRACLPTNHDVKLPKLPPFAGCRLEELRSS